MSQLQSAFLWEAVVRPSSLPWSWLGTAGHDISKCGGQVLQIQALAQRRGMKMGGQSYIKNRDVHAWLCIPVALPV